MRHQYIITLLWGLFLFSLSANNVLADKNIPAAPHFKGWLNELKVEAQTQGVTSKTVNKALGSIQRIPRVLELDRHQPEFTLTFWSYMSKAVNDARINKGKKLLLKHKNLFDKVYKKYGVPPRFLVAFWGLESNFGQYTGIFPVVGALVTLAHDRRRSIFFREQLLTVLKLIDQGDIEFDTKASWAGAMGNHQFIPTTYRDFAVDSDGDGKRDLWNTMPDIFASAANYLKEAGWDKGRTWGREVNLPKNFSYEFTGLKVKKKMTEWRKLKVRQANGKELPSVDLEASIILPAGYQGPAFLVYENYHTIMVWNRSILYALAVGHLADRLNGGAPIQAKMPKNDRPLLRSDIVNIQRILTVNGFDTGDADGVVGLKTRSALKAFQKSSGLPADGYPSIGSLDRLQKLIK
jgi:membrane-bound lytic murein transglycosylase B